MKSIAIIGAGFTGTALACTLIRRAVQRSPSSDLKIFLIEKDLFAGGMAYSTNCPSLLLNVPAGSMSAFIDEPDHFVLWAEKRNEEISQDTFAPRLLYKEYLQDLLHQAEQSQTKHCLLEKMRGEVVRLDRKEKGFLLHLMDGREIFAEQIVLAMGNFPPLSHGTQDQSCFQSLISGSIPSSGDVLIIGTALSMIDQVAKLRHENYTGQIHALSRHGYLPLPPMSSIKAMFLPRELFPKKNTASNWFRYIRRMVEQKNIHALVNAKMYIERSWHLFSLIEKKRYARHLQSYVHFLHHVPESMRDLINKEIQNKQLHIHAGKILSIKKKDNFEVIYAQRFNEEKRKLEVEAIFNCSGSPHYLEKIEDSLITYLLKSGLIRSDPDGMILDRASSLQIIDNTGEEVKGAFALGAIKKMPFPPTTPVLSISKEIKQLVEALL